MSLHGLGVVAIWHDLLPQAKANFYEWHNREHMPERVGIPGFLRGRRYIAVHGTPEYFNLYEALSPEVLSGQDYMQRLNSPTPWTREVVASFRGVARSICRVLYSGGVGQGAVMVTVRFAVESSAETEVTRLLRQEALPRACDMAVIVGAHLCRADEAGSRVETAEKKARNDATEVPSWILLVEAISVDAAEACVLQVITQLRECNGVHGIDQATYRLEYQRCKLPWGES